MANERSLRVFISAVSSEFESVRVQISNTLLKLDMHPMSQDYFAPDHRSIPDMLRSKIASCDAVICLLGRAYGCEPKAMPRGGKRRSYTQLEHEIAVALGKPVFVFLASPDCPVDHAPADPPKLLELQQEHVRRLTSTDQHWTEFRSLQELVHAVSVLRISGGLRGTSTIVSKGLRSFDQSDRDFFLRLLPGPYDENGLPESIRRWLRRIEGIDAAPLTVGVIFGPSGCGKSSMIKAGLLPRLPPQIIPLYIEAKPEDTVGGILQQLRRRLPNLPADLSLEQALSSLTKGMFLDNGQKLLLLLDQFEQWLHSRSDLGTAELTRALRHCDGDHVQCLILVRDDYWTPLTRFLNALGIPLRENENSAMVDLFDLGHARKVLIEFGRAFGCWPAEGEPHSPAQEAFLDRAIHDLSQDGHVISIRLALSAEMLKGRPWTIATLKEVGGISGLGETFLEQTFGDRAPNKKHREHQRGAIAILRALLPEPGTEIKGQMRSLQQLRELSGYGNRDEEFSELIHILDAELRLITPTGRDDSVPPAGDERYYQLTHDYLVPMLCAWLPRKLQETRRGRASLLLASRTSHWNAQKEDRFLPSAREYVVIRMLTSSRLWTDDQKTMMRRARHVHSLRALMVMIGLLLLGTTTMYAATTRKAQRAQDVVRSLLRADIGELAKAIDELKYYRPWADPLLRTALQTGDDQRVDGARASPGESTESHAINVRLRAALALLPDNGQRLENDQRDFLSDRLLDRDLKTFLIVRDCLMSHRAQFREPLWAILDDREAGTEQRSRAAMALAAFSSAQDEQEETHWRQHSQRIAESMLNLSINLSDYALVIEALRPASRHLIEPLMGLYRRAAQPDVRYRAANILAVYAEDNPETLAELAVDADPASFEVIFGKLKSRPDAPQFLLRQLGPQRPFAPEAPLDDVHARQSANAAIALLRLNRAEAVWPQLQFTRDPLLRSHIIERAARYGAPPDLIIQGIGEAIDPSIRRAQILALGQFEASAISDDDRKSLVAMLAERYRGDSDPGTHGAIEWLLSRWSETDAIGKMNDELSQTGKVEGRGWFVNHERQTMVVLEGGAFMMGSPVGDTTGEAHEDWHEVSIDHAFAIAAHEVTNEEFRRFPRHSDWETQLEAWIDRKEIAREQVKDPRCPAVGMTWYEAADYCNWLSQQDGIPEDEWCYLPNSSNTFGEAMRPAANFLKRRGYRLPTEEEWEYACRAGTTTTRYYGQGDELLPAYACFGQKPFEMIFRVGTLKPNDWGLFDTLGNALEWCQDGITQELKDAKDAPVFLAVDAVVMDANPRIMRGAMRLNLARHVRVPRRLEPRTTRFPNKRDHIFGFRPVRTIPSR